MIRVELAGAQPLLLMLDLDASATLASARAALSSRMSEQDGFVSDGAVVARDMEAAFTPGEARGIEPCC